MKTTTKAPVKLVLYGRLSKQKDFNLGNQYGFDSQAWDFDNYLSSLDNYEVIGRFEEFFSGRGDFHRRPEFMKALRLCKQEGATLVVTKIDRLSRDVESGSHLLNNYNIVVTSQPSADKMVLHILLTVAQNESDLISKRTKAALDAARRGGVKLGAANENWQAANKAKADILRKRTSNKAVSHAEKYRTQVELLISMKLPFDKMADKMKELKLTTQNGNNYTAGSMRSLCKYLGYDGKSVASRYEQFVGRDL